MGGGGVMRTAAKVAGIGVASAGLRNLTAASPAEHAVRQASRPVSAALSSSSSSWESKVSDIPPPHTAASWDMDDWDFGGDEELVMNAGEPMPRMVFDAVPSFQEAKEATTELKDAIDKVYLSSNTSEYESSSPTSEASVHSPFLSGTMTKYPIIDAISSPSLPNQALQAFKFLSTNPEAQNIVASVASDPNVWNAVMQNQALNDFLESHKKVAAVEAEEASDVSDEIAQELLNRDQTSNPRNGFDGFMDIVQNIKLTVTEMVSNVSNSLNNIFGVPLSAEKTSSDANGNKKGSFMDPISMGGIMGLTMLVVMVVLLKRA